jgi:hypothetical protein
MPLPKGNFSVGSIAALRKVGGEAARASENEVAVAVASTGEAKEDQYRAVEA